LLAVPSFLLIQSIATETRKSLLIPKLALIALLSAASFSQVEFLRNVLADFLDRWQYSPPLAFIARQFQWLFEYQLTPFGHGLGSTMSAARRLGEIRLIETFYVKILYEVGIAGFIAFLLLLGAIAVATFLKYRSLSDPVLKPFALCLWLFIAFISLNPYYYPLMVDPVTVYYWLVAGILFKLPALETMPVSLPLEFPKAWLKGDCPLTSRESAGDPDLEAG
jgi:hypothetical protein